MTAGEGGPGGPQPGQGALGVALRRALAGYRRGVDADLAAAGSAGRRFPEGRVLLMCAGPGEVTISDIGRRLQITRQGASKVIAALRERGYVTVSPSPADGREKLVALTPRAVEYLAVLYQAAQHQEARLREAAGDAGVRELFRLLDLIADGEPLPLEDAPALHALRWRDEHDQPPGSPT
jgi:DNA-binding MarR family transcriptional regulator